MTPHTTTIAVTVTSQLSSPPFAFPIKTIMALEQGQDKLSRSPPHHTSTAHGRLSHASPPPRFHSRTRAALICVSKSPRPTDCSPLRKEGRRGKEGGKRNEMAWCAHFSNSCLTRARANNQLPDMHSLLTPPRRRKQTRYSLHQPSD